MVARRPAANVCGWSRGDVKTAGTASNTSTPELSARYFITKYAAAQHNGEYAVAVHG
jgi:hypothetical protein